MKSLIILFADNFSSFGFKNSFDGKSAFEITLDWAKNAAGECGVAVFCFDSNKELVEKALADCDSAKTGVVVKCRNEWTNEILFAEISDSLSKAGADYAIFTFAFNPFINLELTQKLIETHSKFKSEYSFADGFPLSVSPEILDKGLVNILGELIKSKDELKNCPVTKSSIFDLIKTDINSFEIETEISTTDWRLYRFDFSCDKKENYIACINLFEKTKGLPDSEKNDIQKICEVASKDVKVLKTIPAYFNIQISDEYESKNPYCAYHKFALSPVAGQESVAGCGSCGGNKGTGKMSLESFKLLVEKINDFNPDAVVSLSLWGDPVLHPQLFDFVNEVIKYPGLTALIETDGFDFSKTGCAENSPLMENLKNLSLKCNDSVKRKNGFAPVLWLVNVDAMSQSVYEKIHPQCNLENAVASVKLLNSLFAGNVYAQYLRITDNEDELENFFRTYKEPSSISGGKFIIQKYDHFCKKMPQVKSADLAPIERNPCWHLRRDFNVMADGSVPVCREKSFESPAGNAFAEGLETIWQRIDSVLQNDVDGKYCNGCEACDEYYTFNF